MQLGEKKTWCFKGTAYVSMVCNACVVQSIAQRSMWMFYAIRIETTLSFFSPCEYECVCVTRPERSSKGRERKKRAGRESLISYQSHMIDYKDAEARKKKKQEKHLRIKTVKRILICFCFLLKLRFLH